MMGLVQIGLMRWRIHIGQIILDRELTHNCNRWWKLFKCFLEWCARFSTYDEFNYTQTFGEKGTGNLEVKITGLN